MENLPTKDPEKSLAPLFGSEKTDLIEKKYWNAFNLIKEVGPIKLKKVIDYFPTLRQAYRANEKEFEVAGLDKKTIDSILISRQEIDIEKEFSKLENEGIEIITIKDDSYPPLLKEIYAYPPILYARGNLFEAIKDKICLGVIGTRNHSLYGKQAALEITESLSKLGITIVSGLARGIDTIAHQTCIKNKCHTVAVLGSGIDERSIYPSFNRELAREISQQSAVISEYPIGTLPLKQNFPARNRIVSGLCHGVLVIEAPEKSGALITAKYALDQNREVFAIPGPINSPASYGTNNLIKLGAKLVSDVKDIIEELNLSLEPVPDIVNNTGDNDGENNILKFLSREPMHIDTLIKNSNLKASDASATLTILEIKGKIRNLGGMNYVLA